MRPSRVRLIGIPYLKLTVYIYIYTSVVILFARHQRRYFYSRTTTIPGKCSVARWRYLHRYRYVRNLKTNKPSRKQTVTTVTISPRPRLQRRALIGWVNIEALPHLARQVALTRQPYRSAYTVH